MIQQEGIENVWKRTSVYAAATRAAAVALGLGVFSKSPSDSVTGINYPAGFTDKEFRGALRKQLNMNVAAGQGTMEGKIFRISHMGYVDQTDTLGVIAGVEIILRQQGYKFEFGAGVAAAHKELANLQGGEGNTHHGLQSITVKKKAAHVPKRHGLLCISIMNR